MKMMEPLIPAGWQLAKTYQQDDFANEDERRDSLADSYEIFSDGSDLPFFVFIIEEIPKSQTNSMGRKSIVHGNRKLLVAVPSEIGKLKLLFANEDIVPKADEGGKLGDSLVRMNMDRQRHLRLEFWGNSRGENWSLTYFFIISKEAAGPKIDGSEIVLSAKVEHKANPTTKAWNEKTENFVTGEIKIVEGGYTTTGKEWSNKPIITAVPTAPLLKLKTLKNASAVIKR